MPLMAWEPAVKSIRKRVRTLTRPFMRSSQSRPSSLGGSVSFNYLVSDVVVLKIDQ